MAVSVGLPLVASLKVWEMTCIVWCGCVLPTCFLYLTLSPSFPPLSFSLSSFHYPSPLSGLFLILSLLLPSSRLIFLFLPLSLSVSPSLSFSHTLDFLWFSSSLQETNTELYLIMEVCSVAQFRIQIPLNMCHAYDLFAWLSVLHFVVNLLPHCTTCTCISCSIVMVVIWQNTYKVRMQMLLSLFLCDRWCEILVGLTQTNLGPLFFTQIRRRYRRSP